MIMYAGWRFQPSWKNISQMGRIISHILWKIKNVWNHQPVIMQLSIVFIDISPTNGKRSPGWLTGNDSSAQKLPDETDENDMNMHNLP